MTSMISQADRPYSPGDLILTCTEPLVQVTKYQHRLFTCDRCMRCSVSSSVVCSACRKVYFCSEKCQEEAWQRWHHLECGIFARHKQLQFEQHGIDYMQRLTLRLYLLMVHQPEIRQRKFRLHNGLERQLDDMEYHPTELKDSAQFAGILNYCKLYQIDTSPPEVYDLLLRAYGILHVNSFGIDCYTESGGGTGASGGGGDVTIEHCGTGLYVEASVFDHSCVPNACASGDGLRLEIRATAPIAPGDTIYIDYLQDIMSRDQRRTALNERYFFTCQCSRGCGASASNAFDRTVDYKRYEVLNRVVDTMLGDQLLDSGAPGNQSSGENLNWTQIYRCWKQRVRVQETYYATAGYHPCLTLFFRDFLRFLLVNQQRIAATQQQQSNSGQLLSLSAAELEQDLLEFGMKTKQHLAVTHGVEHVFYTKLFNSCTRST